ncbi:hypothetical protein SO802_016370 [Lithocarpus litseifolius]|uniref:SET domain-containing protein n=1 Tax=Lithocarpus litseifolius TaxID=425828 RepID=A0AAW2CYW5_9ROSI
MATQEEAKLERFLQWLQVNGVELRGCKIKHCDSKGFGIFSAANQASDGVLLVVPLDLAITPMRVLQDSLLGPECRAMFEEGEVDDRFLMNLFLTLERLRKNSSWKPYLDMLPTSFGNPLWFTDDELLELKGTTLYRATELQKKKLQTLYYDKVKPLVKKLLTLDGDSESEVCFEDFLWANSVFWTRALNIPLPHSYVFPQTQEEDGNFATTKDSELCTNYISSGEDEKGCRVQNVDSQVNGVTSTAVQGETIWVEGLVPGIDFCNHGTLSTKIRNTLNREHQNNNQQKAPPPRATLQELLYLYGFVIDNNPDDYLMVHYPMEAIQSVPFSDSKVQLLEAQKAELRCLLPRSLLDRGFFSECTAKIEGNDKCEDQVHSHSWSGQRKMPSYLNKLVFPDNFLTALRTVALQEDEIFQVSSMLEELVGSGGERQPSDTEVRAAVWEACGDSGALQLLVDLLQIKMVDLEENSGAEDCDIELLKEVNTTESQELQIPIKETEALTQQKLRKLRSKNRRSSIIYRRGQKQLTRLFLKEAEHALQLALSERN